MKEQKKEFIKIFENSAQHRSRSEFFNDFVECCVVAIHNRLVFDHQLESNYLRIQAGYGAVDMRNMAKLLTQVVLAFRSGYFDFLGEVFMELDLGNGRRGQIFTPYCTSQLMVKASFHDIEKKLLSAPFVTMMDPCAGSGSMAIAFAECVANLGYDPQSHLWVQCYDIDERCAYMTYIQLALLGIPAEIVIGNTLTLEVRKVLRTPEHYLSNWGDKLRRQSDTEISCCDYTGSAMLEKLAHCEF